ncbi:MAG: alpha/beta hydrolase-fold protein, partial [Anaerolineales bacterium]
MSLLDTHVRTLASTRVGVEYEITIWLPPSYATGQSTYPVVYDLDGTYIDFGLATSATTTLLLSHEIPDVILVGIGNRIAGLADCMRHRNRDYTPPPHPDHPGEGGAPQFIEFLEMELIPFIEANYRADPGRPDAHRLSSGRHIHVV